MQGFIIINKILIDFEYNFEQFLRDSGLTEKIIKH
jgi:hypothetical protein